MLASGRGGARKLPRIEPMDPREDPASGFPGPLLTRVRRGALGSPWAGWAESLAWAAQAVAIALGGASTGRGISGELELSRGARGHSAGVQPVPPPRTPSSPCCYVPGFQGGCGTADRQCL